MKYISALVLFFWLVVSHGALRAQETAKLRVGIIPVAGSLPLFLAMEKGFFAEAGLKVEIEHFFGSQPILSAIVGGSLQLGHGGYLTVFKAIEQGFDFLVVAPQEATRLYPGPKELEDVSPVAALRTSEVREAKELKGRSLAVNEFKGINQLYAMEWLSRKGIDPKKEIRWVEVGFPQMFGVLKAKSVDAVYTAPPFSDIARETGELKVLGYPFAEVHRRELPLAGYFARSAWLEGKAALAQSFAQGLKKGVEYAQAYKAEWAPIMWKYARLKEEVAAKIRWVDWPRPVNLQDLQAMADLALKWDLLSRRLEVSKYIYKTALE